MEVSQRKSGAPLSARTKGTDRRLLPAMDRHLISESEDWRRQLRGNPLPWLLHPDTPAVRHLALCDLLGRPSGDAEVAEARAAAMATDPIAAILAAQCPDGYWEKPGPGYATKYRGTVWQLIFLDQLGADPADGRIQAACAYVLAHSLASTGGFGASGRIGTAPRRHRRSSTA